MLSCFLIKMFFLIYYFKAGVRNQRFWNSDTFRRLIILK